ENITVIGIPGATGSGTHTVLLDDGQVPSGGISINLDDRNDRLTIDSTVDAVAVQAGAGNDIIDVGTFVGGNLSRIPADVTVNGGADTDTVRINDTGSVLARDYTVTDTAVTVTKQIVQGGVNDEFDVNYAGTENLTVNAGAASGGIYADIFYVRGTAATTKTV